MNQFNKLSGFFQHKETGITEAPRKEDGAYDTEILSKLGKDSQDYSKWEMIDEVSNKYNRLILYRADMFHQSLKYFGDNISRDFQQNVETKFFNHFLKEGGKGESGLPEAMMYDTGKREWETFAQWPPKAVTQKTFYLGEDQELATAAEPDFENTFITQ